MKRKLLLSVLCLSLALPGVVAAGDPMSEALALVPSEAIGFVCIPSIKELDANFQNTIDKLGLSMFLPPPMNSLAGAMRMSLQMSEGLNDQGALLLVFMPPETSAEFGDKMAILVPASDSNELLMAMGAEEGEGGAWSLALFEEPAAAVPAGTHVIFASSAENAKAVAASKENITAKLKPTDLALLKGLTVAAWFDADKLFTLFKDDIAGFTDMIVMMQQAGGGPLGAKQGESTKEAIEIYTTGMRSFMVGAGLDEHGLDVRLGVTSKPGTELHKLLKITNTEESLLKGLPKGKYMLALGQLLDPAAMEAGLKNLDPYFEAPAESEMVDAEQLGKLKNLLKGWIKLHTGFRCSIEALPPGPLGLVGASLVLDTTDSAKWLETFAQLIAVSKQVCTDEKVKQILEALTHDPQAETIGGVQVQQVKFDLSKIEEAEEEDLEDAFAVIGREGLLLRVAAVDDKRVVIGFGGGAQRMGQLVEQARKSDAPLDDDPGIKRVSALLPKSRNSVGYLAADNIVTLIRNIGRALEEEDEFPLQLEGLNAPAALVGRGGEGWSQVDLFLPTELMVAGKDAIFTLMGMGGPAMETEVEEGQAVADEPK